MAGYKHGGSHAPLHASCQARLPQAGSCCARGACPAAAATAATVATPLTRPATAQELLAALASVIEAGERG
jgi:hypothetical protein